MSKQLRPDDLLDRIQSLEDRIDDLEAENELLYDKLEDAKVAAGKDRADIRKQINETAEELTDEFDDKLDQEQRHRSMDDSRILRRLAAVENELDVGSDDAMESAAAGRGQAMTALARLLKFGPEVAVENPTAKHTRARVIAEKMDNEDWGRRTHHSGDHYRQLCSKKDDLRTRLSDVLDEGLQWNQVYRAMETVADLSEGTVTLREGNESEGKYVLELPLTRSGGDA